MSETLGYKLYCFDLDNTLADRDKDRIYPHVYTWLYQNWPGMPAATRFAICTNQGGPACRDAGWKFSKKFPTVADVEMRLLNISQAISLLTGDYPLNIVSYAYKIKSSGEIIFPKGWRKAFRDPSLRKPEPGMILRAMKTYNVLPDQTIMIGDGEEDAQAAKAAGVSYFHPAEFFNER